MWPMVKRGIRNQAKKKSKCPLPEKELGKRVKLHGLQSIRAMMGGAGEALNLQSSPNTHTFQRWMVWTVQKDKGILWSRLAPPWAGSW